MKFKVDQSEFVKAVQAISKVVKNNPQMPILACIVIDGEKEEGRISVMATDLQSGIKISVGAEIEEKGRVAVNLSQFLEYVQNLKKMEVGFEVNAKSERIAVKQGGSKASFALSSVEDYPEFLPKVGEGGCKLKLDELNSGLKRVGIAVAGDDSRPVLTGLLIKAENEGEMLLVGTDGYRLSLQKLVSSGRLESGLLVPAKVLSTVIKGMASENIILGFDGKSNQVFIKGDKELIGIRLIQGDFPPYQKIIPESSQTKIVVDRTSLLMAVKQMAVFARLNANIVRWDVGKVIQMSTQAGGVGSGNAEVDATFEGDEVAIGFNFRYLQEFLNVLKGDELEMVFNGALAPVKCKEVGDDKFLHIIMPVKLQE